MLNDHQSLRRRSRWLGRLAALILICLVAALALEAVVIAKSEDPRSGLTFWLPYRLSTPFYLWAVWTMHRAFSRIADGGLFDQVLPASLSRLGAALAGGAAASVFITPWLLRLLVGPRNGALAAFDPPAITIGMVGLLLMVMSGLFARAVDMRRELDEIL